MRTLPYYIIYILSYTTLYTSNINALLTYYTIYYYSHMLYIGRPPALAPGRVHNGRDQGYAAGEAHRRGEGGGQTMGKIYCR